jgi:hypothetical protein
MATDFTGYIADRDFTDQHEHILFIDRLIRNCEYELDNYNNNNNLHIITEQQKRFYSLCNRLDYLNSINAQVDANTQQRIYNIGNLIGTLKQKINDGTYNIKSQYVQGGTSSGSSSSDTNTCLFKENSEDITYHPSDLVSETTLQDIIIPRGFKIRVGDQDGNISTSISDGNNKRNFLIITFCDIALKDTENPNGKERKILLQFGDVN